MVPYLRLFRYAGTRSVMAEVRKIEFYVPESHLEKVKSAMFAAGAGHIGDYDSCAWQTRGQGQYRPLEGSSPYHGQTGKVEKVEEYKVEMVCIPDLVEAVIAALKKSHPYEEVAYTVIRPESLPRAARN